MVNVLVVAYKGLNVLVVQVVVGNFRFYWALCSVVEARKGSRVNPPFPPPPRRSVGREGGLATFNPPPQVVGREGLVSQASSSTLSPPLPPPVAGQEGRVVCPPPPRNSGGREGDPSGSEEVLYDLEQ